MDPVLTPPPAPSSPNLSPVYASVGRRWVAAFVDGVIIGLGSLVITIPLSIMAGVSQNDTLSTVSGMIGQLITLVLSYGYYVYMISSRGQTLGKMALGIKVVKIGTDQKPEFTSAFLREVVGKMLSGIVFGLGYLWAIWDKDKQSWHDKIAKTIVVKV
jgi:uncharacterized RDD family membrane protein YckC